jgi:excisionase family DNA binding protein
MPPDSLPAMLYGAGSIAAYLGMSEHACRHLISESVIPTFKIGSRICARRETIDQWIIDHEARASQTALRIVEDLPQRRGG